MVLGKLPVPGRPTILITVGQGPTALAVGAGGGCLDVFTLIYPFFPLSPSLWETARYRLKYCLKGPLNPKQPTNQDKKYPGQITLSFIQQWLNNQDSYSIQKQVRRRFRTPNDRVTFIGEQFDVDLMSVSNLAKYNDGVQYWLAAIDILSKKLWVKPIKNKTLFEPRCNRF